MAARRRSLFHLPPYVTSFEDAILPRSHGQSRRPNRADWRRSQYVSPAGEFRFLPSGAYDLPNWSKSKQSPVWTPRGALNTQRPSPISHTLRSVGARRTKRRQCWTEQIPDSCLRAAMHGGMAPVTLGAPPRSRNDSSYARRPWDSVDPDRSGATCSDHESTVRRGPASGCR